VIAVILCVFALHFTSILVLVPSLISLFKWLFISALFVFTYKKNNLTAWILFSMPLGIAIGTEWPQLASEANIFSKIFLKLIKCIIGPLIFGTLVVGIAGHGDIKKVGKMAWKSLVYFEIITTLAIVIGLVAINFSQAGKGISIPKSNSTEILPIQKPKSVSEIILHAFPENIAKTVAEGEVLQLVIFSMLFGIALSLTPIKEKKIFLDFAESLSHVMFKFTEIVMYLAPVGVCAAMAYTVGHMGIGILVNLFQLLATLYVALLALVVLVFIPTAIVFKINILHFFKAIVKPVSLAFATTSSEAALPSAMEAMTKLGVSKKVVSFVMPMGYSFNLDGTSLYLSLASVFVAQAAGIELSWEQQISMVFLLMLTSKGVAGVPRASLIILLGAMAQFNLPVEPVFIILGIDELMDMARTSINVTGNCLASAVIAKLEGEYQPTNE